MPPKPAKFSSRLHEYLDESLLAIATCMADKTMVAKLNDPATPEGYGQQVVQQIVVEYSRRWIHNHGVDALREIGTELILSKPPFDKPGSIRVVDPVNKDGTANVGAFIAMMKVLEREPAKFRDYIVNMPDHEAINVFGGILSGEVFWRFHQAMQQEDNPT